jgi:hypothetical protein
MEIQAGMNWGRLSSSLYNLRERWDHIIKEMTLISTEERC